nr:MAG TPA: hypothetical protein [Bacteriophage sp.]
MQNTDIFIALVKIELYNYKNSKKVIFCLSSIHTEIRY